MVGWDGYLFPYIFNIGDFEPITGRVHQPPPVHQTFAGAQLRGLLVRAAQVRLSPARDPGAIQPLEHQQRRGHLLRGRQLHEPPRRGDLVVHGPPGGHSARTASGHGRGVDRQGGDRGAGGDGGHVPSAPADARGGRPRRRPAIPTRGCRPRTRRAKRSSSPSEVRRPSRTDVHRRPQAADRGPHTPKFTFRPPWLRSESTSAGLPRLGAVRSWRARRERRRGRGASRIGMARSPRTSQPSANAARISACVTRRGPQSPGSCSLKQSRCSVRAGAKDARRDSWTYRPRWLSSKCGRGRCRSGRVERRASIVSRVASATTNWTRIHARKPSREPSQSPALTSPHRPHRGRATPGTARSPRAATGVQHGPAESASLEDPFHDRLWPPDVPGRRRADVGRVPAPRHRCGQATRRGARTSARIAATISAASRQQRQGQDADEPGRSRPSTST